jgi:hypothetical protein
LFDAYAGGADAIVFTLVGTVLLGQSRSCVLFPIHAGKVLSACACARLEINLLPIQFAEVAEARPAASAVGPDAPRFAFELNPVTITSLYRPGLTFEASLPEHLALNVTPSFELALNGGLFGEIGIRRYTSVLSGAFVGLSLLAGSFSHRCEGSSATHDGHLYGVAGDIGYQWLTPHDVVIGLGAGIQIQRSVTECGIVGTELEEPLIIPSLSKSGVLPRLQFAVGISWPS